MARSWLPADALARYIATGESRSYESLAADLGVSKAAVAARAKAEDWQSVVESIERDASEKVMAQAAKLAQEARSRQLKRIADLQGVAEEVLNPERVRGLLATVLKAAIQKEDMTAARILLDRIYGKARSQPLTADGLDLPSELETTKDVRRAAAALLKAVIEGAIAPEDAMRTATVVEAARKSIEVDELEQRIAQVELELQRDRKR
ncbi:MAG: hypothetical protein KDB53_21630 [Planctomycetes bacterium]|nr:hypothetical protein [Planctomycetota bacterium]